MSQMITQTDEQIKIREAKPEDIEDLIKLIEIIFREYDMQFVVEEELPDFLHFKDHYDGKNTLLVAEHDQSEILAGCTALKIEKQLPRLSRVYVRKKDRGKGVGRRLVQTAEELAASKKFEWIHLWTDTRFKRAHKFYRDLDYTYTGRVKPLGDVNDSYEYHFKKKLDSTQ